MLEVRSQLKKMPLRQRARVVVMVMVPLPSRRRKNSELDGQRSAGEVAVLNRGASLLRNPWLALP